MPTHSDIRTNKIIWDELGFHFINRAEKPGLSKSMTIKFGKKKVFRLKKKPGLNGEITGFSTDKPSFSKVVTIEFRLKNQVFQKNYDN